MIICTDKEIDDLNEVLYREYVTEDGVNFKFPFGPGTTRYLTGLGKDHDLVLIDDRVTEIQSRDSEKGRSVKAIVDRKSHKTIAELRELRKFNEDGV